MFPLFQQAQHDPEECIASLHESNVDIADANGYTVLHYASRYGHETLLSYILENFSTNMINEKVGRWKETALHLAIRYSKNDNICRMLLYNGIDVNIRNVDYSTALHYCAIYNNIQIASEILLRDTVDVNAINFKHETALSIAAELGHLEICKQLLNKKALIHFVRRDPFLLACQHSHLPICELLLDQGANVFVKCFYTGKSALEIALHQGNALIASFLLDHGALIDNYF